MQKISKIIILGFLLFLCQLGFSQAAVFQKIPGTALYAIAPKNFILNDKFNGFVNYATDSVISAATLPPAPESWKNSFFDKKKFTTISSINGFSIEQSKTIQTEENYTLTVYSGKQAVELQNGEFIYYRKWLTIFFMDNAQYIISIEIGHDDDFNDAMAQDFFKSIRFDQNVTVEEQLAALPFTFEIVQPFQFVGSIMNSAALFTIAPIGDEKQNRPNIMISKGVENVEGQSLEQILQVYIKSLQGTVDDVKNQKITTIEFAGLPAVKLEAQAIVKGENSDIIVFATITKDNHPFYMHVTGPENSLKNYADVVDKIANSIKMRD